MTDEYWMEQTSLENQVRNMPTCLLMSYIWPLESVLDANHKQFQVYTLKRLKTNEQREFIDGYYETMRLLSILRRELRYRAVLLGIH